MRSKNGIDFSADSLTTKKKKQKQKQQMVREVRPGVREASPDSVIYTAESNLSSCFPSSASVDRSSFSLSDTSPQLSRCDGQQRDEGLSVHISCNASRFSANKADFEVVNQNVDSARNSFSNALKECQERRRSRSDALLKKVDRRRPVSLDLNNVAAMSPHYGIRKSSAASHRVCAFQSPGSGTPTYTHSVQKGWSSERVPMRNSATRRPANLGLLPYYSGRTLPSKWEDAERWICSPPVSGDVAFRASVVQPQRRIKSKSGPLSPPDAAYCSLYSPAVIMCDGVNRGNFVENSPFSAGVVAGDGLRIQSSGNAGAFPVYIDPCMARSVSIHGCSEIFNQSPPPSGGTCEKVDGVKDAASDFSSDVSRREMGTQMSAEESIHSSPETSLTFSASTPSALPIVEMWSVQAPKSEVRDVRVDERVTVTRWPKKNRIRIPKKGSGVYGDWKGKGDSPASAWDVSEATKRVSKVKREDAKITAWENLQKAKAEAAIRKLEMKLEKKRSSSMDKIVNKLRMAQKKAQGMRSSVLASQAHQVTQTSQEAMLIRRTRQMSSLSGCFTCHAF